MSGRAKYVVALVDKSQAERVVAARGPQGHHRRCQEEQDSNRRRKILRLKGGNDLSLN